MNDDNSRSDTTNDKPLTGLTAGDQVDSAPGGGRREPVFTDFDEDDDYEESDRDTDFASAYEEEELEDDEFLEPLEEDGADDAEVDWQVLGGHRDTRETQIRDAGKNPWDVAESPGTADTAIAAATTAFGAPSKPGDSRESDFEEDFDEDYPEEEPEDDWDDEEDYPEEPDDYEKDPGNTGQGWPLGLIVVAIVALVLLAAGGYGVIQQRSAMEEEIRQLQASLATAADPAEVSATREQMRAMEQTAAKSQATIEALTLENRRLTDTVAGLEKQLDAQQAPVARDSGTKPANVSTPKPPSAKTATKPAATQPAAAASPAGRWFVNFSSYSQRSAAENWVKKLKPSAGKAIVAPTNQDGKTIYRVRIIGLADRAQAQKVASQLQAAHGLPQLWVGAE